MSDQNLTKRLTQLTPKQKSLLQQRLSEQTMSGHTRVAQTLKKQGLTHIYTIPGIPVHETLASCLQARLRIISVRHQQAAVMMALAQNYSEGRMVAAVIFSKGPAILNAITGISIAKDNCWPLLIIGGSNPLSMQDLDAFQQLNTLPIMQPLTKFCAVINTAEKITGAIEKAVEASTSGRYGPSFIEIPEDILSATSLHSTFTQPLINKKNEACLPLHSIQSASNTLVSTKRPLIIIGKSVRWSDPHEEIEELVKDFNIPFISSPMGQGYLPDDHPLCFNTDRSYVQFHADVVLIIGARLNWTFRHGSELSKEAYIIQFDADKSAIVGNVAPNIALIGDIKQLLKSLLIKMHQAHPHTSRKLYLKSWTEQLIIRRSDNSSQYQPENTESSKLISPAYLMKQVRDFFPRDSCYIFDGNVSMIAAQNIIHSYFPASRFTAGTNGCMGGGIPFGIGAKINRPDRTTVVISGDFAFGLNAMELETALRYKLPIIVIVVNNSGATGALSHKKFFPKNCEPATLYMQDIRYDKMIIALGGHGEFVNTHEQIIPAFKRSVASGKTSLINVIVDPDAPLFSRS